MAITKNARWRIRTDGDNTNGGGYDPSISGAGTDYTEQAAAQLSLTDLATPGAASTTLTSATGGFTSAMVGNCIRISSGTNFTTGYYFITVYTDTNTVTVDRTPSPAGAGSGGVGKLGGAFGGLHNIVNNAGAYDLPSPASPLVAGNVVYIRGSGSDNPTTPDYSPPNGGTTYTSFPSGSVYLPIIFIGYNGRPMIDPSANNFLNIWSISYHTYMNIKFRALGTFDNVYGMLNGSSRCYNCIFDANGYAGFGLDSLQEASFCHFYNSGAAVTGTYAAIYRPLAGFTGVGTVIDGWGRGIQNSGFNFAASGMIIKNCINQGIYLSLDFAHIYNNKIYNNIIYNNGTDGIYYSGAGGFGMDIHDNIIYGNTNYNINITNTYYKDQHRIYRNAIGNAGIANYNNYNPATDSHFGDIDINLTTNPFIDAASDNFNLNSNAGGGLLLKDSYVKIL